MALDPDEFKEFRERMDHISDMAPLKNEESKELMKKLLGEAFQEIDELVEESRPPRLYVFGRSGAGKSSLINALAGKDVADIGAIEPETTVSKLYNIPFKDHYASWDVVDSRGLFETVPADGKIPVDTVEFMRDDLEEYRPDVLIHVMTPEQVRAGEQDFETVSQLRKEFGTAFPPILFCLNQVDTHIPQGEKLDPSENPSQAGVIKENLDFVHRVLEDKTETTFQKSPITENQPVYGYTFDSDQYVGVLPTYLHSEPYWNDETLATLIGDFLPEQARLQFAQAQREQREKLMRQLSRDVTDRFAKIAGGVGAVPSPVADIAVLSTMQLMLIWLIGSFSCREIETETVTDYMSAAGVSIGAGAGARELARAAIQMLPGLGSAVSAVIAYGTTWGIGRSAEAYFFNDEIKSPGNAVEEGISKFKNQNFGD